MLMTNIDPIRVEIMRLENEEIFDGEGWEHVLSALADSPARFADARRRMLTALENQTVIAGVAGVDDAEIVAVETDGVICVRTDGEY